MTREEEIKILKAIRVYDCYPKSAGEETKEAIEMAIQALEQEPCEDAISRQAAIDAIENEQKKIMRSDWAIDQAKFSAMSEIRELIADLPSVSTEKTGRWITQWNPVHQKEYYYCSECREEYSYDGETGIKMNNYNYCPNCGAKMQEVEE